MIDMNGKNDDDNDNKKQNNEYDDDGVNDLTPIKYM